MRLNTGLDQKVDLKIDGTSEELSVLLTYIDINISGHISRRKLSHDLITRNNLIFYIYRSNEKISSFMTGFYST